MSRRMLCGCYSASRCSSASEVSSESETYAPSKRWMVPSSYVDCHAEGRMDMASYINQNLQDLRLEPMLRLGPNLQQVLSESRE